MFKVDGFASGGENASEFKGLSWTGMDCGDLGIRGMLPVAERRVSEEYLSPLKRKNGEIH